MEYTIKSGQDIFDVSIQHFGDIETGLFAILKDNSIGLNAVGLDREYIASRTLTLNNENAGVIKVKNLFKNLNFVVNNADETYNNLSLGDFGPDFNFDFN